MENNVRVYSSMNEFFAKSSNDKGEFPVLIDDGWKMMMDAKVSATTPASAVSEFANLWEDYPEAATLLRSMRAACEDGIFSDRTDYGPANTDVWDKVGGYTWGVEPVDDTHYYVFLNASGNFIGRVKESVIR